MNFNPSAEGPVTDATRDAALSASAVDRSTQAGLDASKLTLSFTTSPRPLPDEATAYAGDESICTDHMILAAWKEKTGWSAPELRPYGPLTLLPTASCLHYATECFEGMKVYRGYDGKLRVFRPERNVSRFQVSASRVSLPIFDPVEVQKLILILISIDGPKWLPKNRPGSFLYLRPTLIGTQPQLGVRVPKEALLFVVMSFMGRLDGIPGGMCLRTSPENMVRAWAGGFGNAKIGSNYGPSVLAYNQALRDGFHQVLWLYGNQGECTEAGGSNFFIVWKRKNGQKEMVTAPLEDQLILDGVTRKSCLDLARERLARELLITERKYTIAEVMEAAEEGRLLESFSAGTAYFICSVSQIEHQGRSIRIPMGPHGQSGEITTLMKCWLEEIMYGTVRHEWATVVHELDLS